jgi:signal transduction histidine kinase
MENGIQRVIEIIKGLKTFSRGENVAPQPTDIHLCIDSSLTILKSQYKGRILIEKNYGQNIPPVLCLAGPIDQVLINIIGNAIQAIEKNGTIRITTIFRAPKTVEISISDTGMGIPEALRHQIFQPFFTTKEVGKGTGLGLSITVDIIRKHNGHISVASEEGKGTTFTILLPTDMQPLMHEKTSSSPAGR